MTLKIGLHEIEIYLFFFCLYFLSFFLGLGGTAGFIGFSKGIVFSFEGGVGRRIIFDSRNIYSFSLNFSPVL